MKYGNRPNHFWYHPKPVNDIEKINVLKNKKAIKKYGEKGVNGVLEITTIKQ